MAQLNISKPVGDIAVNGTSPNANMFDDVLIVQYLLNKSLGPGKPNPPLPENGTVSPQFFAAIRDYESSRGPMDGRIDPGDATMGALNAIALSEFEGVTDFLERRSIILRINPQWNFTRGDFKTLTDMAGLSLRFDASATWLPNVLKDRFLAVLNKLLKPTHAPSATWGVSSLDWYHCHLGVWSGVPNKKFSAASAAWITTAVAARIALEQKREPFIVFHGLPAGNVALYRPVYEAFVLSADVAILLNTYASLPEAMVVHHTFEDEDWRPGMSPRDPRRHWMVDTTNTVRPTPYAGPAAVNAAHDRDEFDCEGTIQINFLIDKAGVIHPVLGDMLNLSLVTGLSSDALRAPPGIVIDPLDSL